MYTYQILKRIRVLFVSCNPEKPLRLHPIKTAASSITHNYLLAASQESSPQKEPTNGMNKDMQARYGGDNGQLGA